MHISQSEGVHGSVCSCLQATDRILLDRVSGRVHTRSLPVYESSL